MQFVQSIWLWAIAGIIIPVVIHLWNVKQGKTLKVGSIFFHTEAARSHSKSLRLSEWLLLLLRCLLLILLAIILCEPFMETQDTTTKEKGWVLIEQNSTRDAYNKYKPLIDSLLNAGYTFHYFDNGFKEATIEDAVKTTAAVKGFNESYWALLKELNQRIPSKLPVYLFTNNQLQNFTGTRPSVAMNIKWYTFRDTALNHLPPANRGNTMADSSALSIFIYTNKPGSFDATYLKAALDAIRDYTKRRIKTTLVNNPESITGKYDWLFWLSENNLPPALLKNNVFMYEKGKMQYVHSPILTNDNINELTEEDLQVYKIIDNAVAANTYPIWKNGYGNALLSRKNLKDSIYYFSSRFDPEWNDLPWNGQFPQIIYNLVCHTTDDTNRIDLSDKRMIDEQQIQPAIINEQLILPKKELLQKTDLAKYFWIAAFIIFALERFITYRKKKGVVYG
jgi:hypothetical protein